MNGVLVQLCNKVMEYKMSGKIRPEFEQELQMWIANGWLMPNPPTKGLIPLMAVIQPSKGKAHPVMNFKELNEHVDTFTADVDVCTTKLREWH